MIVAFPLARRNIVVMGKEAEIVRQRGTVVDVVLLDCMGRPCSMPVPLWKIKYARDERFDKALSVMHGSWSDTILSDSEAHDG